MTLHKAHHPKGVVHRFYIKRKEEGRGLISIEKCVEVARAGLHNYVQNTEESFISTAWGSSGEQEVAEPTKNN